MLGATSKSGKKRRLQAQPWKRLERSREDVPASLLNLKLSSCKQEVVCLWLMINNFPISQI